jgi:SPOR domain
MVNGLDVKSRDVRTEMDPNDPLWQLTRIMGISAPSEGEKKPVDPQISIEDDFSLDLEQELLLEQSPNVELDASDFSIDDDFDQAFEEDLSHTLQVGEDTPPIVPSLEDELEAMLAGDGQPIAVANDQLSVDLLSEPEGATDREPIVEFVQAAPVSPTLEAEPWLEPEFESLMDDEVGAYNEDEAEHNVPPVELEDPILSQMNRVFGRSNLTPIEPVEATAEVETNFDQVINTQEVSESPAAADFELKANALDDENYADMVDFNLDVEEVSLNDANPFVEVSDLDWDEPAAPENASFAAIEPLERLVGRTELEPVVESAEFAPDAVTAMDNLEIPDFDLPLEAASAAPSGYDLDDDYQGYEPPVSKAPVVASNSVELDDFSLDMQQTDVEADLDFEAMLNDELTASVDNGESGFTYGAGAGVAAAALGSAAYRSRNTDYRDEIPDAAEMADDINAPASYHQKSPRKNTWLIAAAIGAVAILGGGYYALSGSNLGSTGNAPVLVKADPNPVKVAPETPGGKTVANQDLAVYDKVGGEGTELPSQGQLVSESEEPVDIASVATNEPIDPNAKSEERVDPALDAQITSGQAADTIAVSPKKVRTMIVKPDGTLVERPVDPVAEIPADAATAVATPTPDAQVPVAEVPATKVETAAIEPAPAIVPEVQAAEPIAEVAEPVVAEPKATAPAIKVVKTKKIKAPAAETEAATGAAPVLESRPSDQPVNIVGKTGDAAPAAAGETQVAAANPVAEPAPAGSYSMQIASTPSPEAAKSTYAALSRKFGDVLGGRGVNVQKAEVAGKGTVYRVRIPAGSKQEAAALCAQYKSAGGNCFISK